VEASPLVPSPKFQLNEYGAVPPEAEAIKVTFWRAAGEDGL